MGVSLRLEQLIRNQWVLVVEGQQLQSLVHQTARSKPVVEPVCGTVGTISRTTSVPTGSRQRGINLWGAIRVWPYFLSFSFPSTRQSLFFKRPNSLPRADSIPFNPWVNNHPGLHPPETPQWVAIHGNLLGTRPGKTLLPDCLPFLSFWDPWPWLPPLFLWSFFARLKRPFNTPILKYIEGLWTLDFQAN